MKILKNLIASLGVLLLLVSALFVINSASNAQESTYDVTVSPVFFDLSVNPGGSVSDNVRLRNNTNSPISVEVEVKRLTGDETGALTISDDNSDNSLDWFTFEETSYTLNPLEWTSVPFTVTVPEEAAYGYYYTINFQEAGVEETGSTGATITGAAAVPVLLNVRSDGAVAKAELTNFSTSNFINEYLPVEFDVELENTGNVHIRPVGNIFISGNGMENVSTIEVNPGNGAIIPSSTRTFNPSWVNGFIVREVTIVDGEEKTVTKIQWNKLTDFRFGKYTANLVMVYDNGERDVAVEDSISFWVIPWKVIVGGLIALVVIILIIRWGLKKYINREVKKRSSK